MSEENPIINSDYNIHDDIKLMEETIKNLHNKFIERHRLDPNIDTRYKLIVTSGGDELEVKMKL